MPGKEDATAINVCFRGDEVVSCMNYLEIFNEYKEKKI